MHPKDYALLLYLAAIAAAFLGVCALQKRWPWWKDALQVAGVIMAVALVVGFASPPKPKSEAEVTREAQAEHQRQSEIAMTNAMVACQSAIQARLTYPSSYSGTYFSDWNRQFETPQGWEIYKAFEAKNGFGGMLPHVGHCTVTRGGDITVEIKSS